MSRFARARDGAEVQRATSLELFFDLVLVFAITQVSHLVVEDLSWAGASHAALALLVVWWAWNYTTWVMNELDPGSTVVRLLLIAVMLASLLLAVAIPGAFGSHALLFAGSYVTIQVGRHAFLTFAAAGRGSIERFRAARILIWFVASAPVWISGALVEGDARIALWVAALAIDYGAPLAVYRVPFMRPVGEDAWDVETSHFAERFQLFVIIALGETIVLTGATTAQLPLSASRLTAFGLAFVGAAALWWLYFDYVAEIAERRLSSAQAAQRTRMARDGFTYLHVVIVAGIVLTGVGDELVIAHPTESLPAGEVMAVAGGPALYLLAHVLIRLRMAGSVSWKRLGGALSCVGAGLALSDAPALVLATALLAILIAVIVAERVAAARRSARGEASPLEQLEQAR